MSSETEHNELAAFLPRHVLIVDDDPMTLDLMQDHYRDAGFTVDVAAGGEQALAMMTARKPDIVLCDRVMPDLSGAEVLEAMRARGAAWDDVVFVFVTALTDRRDHYAMMPLHPDAYLHKPIVFADADRKLAQVLRKKAADAASR